jgi:arabinogalactan endo-1,4-beta-galactosidase
MLIHSEIKFIFFIFCSIIFGSCNGNNTQEPDENQTVVYQDTQFVMGADLSYVNAILETGSVFRESNGVVKNPYQLFREMGTNLVRVRKWHTPYWQNNLYGSIKYHEAADVAKTIRESKNAGMKVLLDLHYSDNWADPHKQETPKAWQGLSLGVLSDSVYQYTYQYLTYLQKQNLVPEYIQIGNENNYGMCHPVGKIEQNRFTAFCTLLAAGSKAVRDFSAQSNIKPKILIHVAQFQDAKWWLEGVMKSGIAVDFDILGLSHYYKWSEVNDPDKIKTAIQELRAMSKKDLWVVETAFPWTTLNKDNYPNILSAEGLPAGYTATKEGQNKYLQDLTQTIINGGGKGIIYWEPAWISSPLRDQWNTGSAWENATYFDYSNRAHSTLKYMKHKYKF